MKGKVALLLVAIISLFTVIVVGAYVAVAGFGDACGHDIPPDWPGCLGGVFPPLQHGPVAEYTHRLFAALSTLFLLVTTGLFLRDKTASQGVKRTILASALFLVAQVLLGGAVIAGQEDPLLVAVHQGMAVVTFGLAVAAFVQARRPQ